MPTAQMVSCLEVNGQVDSATVKPVCQARRVWIDLDNTPHVPFFRPIMRELEKSGHAVLLTARDAFQVWELAQHLGVNCRKVGRHYGKNPFLKVFGLVFRAMQFTPTIWRYRPEVALSHGARSQMLAANLFGIPTIGLDDYEHSSYFPFSKPKWLIIPKAIGDRSVSHFAKRVRHYEGIKEDVYAAEFVPDPSILTQLKLDEKNIIVTVRPPATEAHYHHRDSQIFFVRFMSRVCATAGVKAVLLPRNRQQEAELRSGWPEWFKGDKVVIPEFAVDGLNLVWHSDLVVSAGGTMNREAAALGVPVYSIFRGRIGAVDQQLEHEGRLILIRSVDDVDRRIEFKRCAKIGLANGTARKALQDILAHLEDILRDCSTR
jgi:uncharacterized protein